LKAVDFEQPVPYSLGMPLVAQNRSSNVRFIKPDFAEFSDSRLNLKKTLAMKSV
jgi:hypothetical protein